MRKTTAQKLTTLALMMILLEVTPSVLAQDEPAPTQARRAPRPRPAERPQAPQAPQRQQAPQQPATTPSPTRVPAPRSPSEAGMREFETGVEYEPVRPTTRVTFNLEDADLPDLVRLISNMTGRRFILPGKARSIKASVFAPTQVTAQEAYEAFLSILEVNGMTVVPVGRYLKIIETSGSESQPLPVSTRGGVPSTDRFMTRLHRVESISAEDAANLLSRFKSNEGAVTAYGPTNTIIITDTGRQISRMLGILRSVDVTRTGEQVWIEPVHYAAAAELADRLLQIFPTAESTGARGSQGGGSTAAPRRAGRQTAGGSAPGGATPTAAPAETTVGAGYTSAGLQTILPDERTNSLIIVATERAYLRVLEMIRRLDVPLEGEGRIHVHQVQYADATTMADTLNAIVGGQGGTSAASGTTGAQGAQPRAGASAAAGRNTMFEGEVRVTAYEPTNSLVITASLHDYAALRSVIKRLDSPRKQVFIEAVVMELGISRSSKLGFSFHGGLPDSPADGALSILGFNAGSSIATVNQDSLTGLALGIRGPTIDNSQQLLGVSVPAFGVVVNALASTGDANVLSTPHIIAMDNVQAEITVGENIPLQTSGIPMGALTGLAGAAGLGGAAGAMGGLGAMGAMGAMGMMGRGGVGGMGGMQRQDVGTTLKITPHINDADEIRLEIEEEISERGATEGTLGVVSINRRVATTEVMVRDQQTVVIGGLMRDTQTTSETKIPVLGDIPVLGALFRKTEKTRKKTNLLLFLTPYIIRDAADLRAIFERKMRERQEFIDRHFVFAQDDYRPAIDYSRTRGAVSEIIRELDVMDFEAALVAAAAAEPVREHLPSAPVGTYRRGGGGAGGGEDTIDEDMMIEPETPEAPVEGPGDTGGE
jgi:general secretion pathway protein D